MFKHLLLENFGTFSRFEWSEHASVNIIIGENDTGKTYVLKALYCIAKSLEDYTNSAQAKSWKEILADKIYWVYQPNQQKLGALVKRGGDRLHLAATIWENSYQFEFGKDTKNTITKGTEEVFKPLEPKVVYVPTKEVLTALGSISATEGQFGFDETYHDLIRALRIPIQQKKFNGDFQKALKALAALFDGDIIMRNDEFILKRGRETYSMPQVAEGIKKISTITTLIRNQSIQPGTVLILDEPETSLHPNAIIAFCEMLFYLSQAGVQVYLATHSYFVIKQFEILARKHKTNIQICSLDKTAEGVTAKFSDLQEGLPDNPIVDASIGLYEQDVELGLS